MKINIEVEERKGMYEVKAYTGERDEQYVTDNLFSNPVLYEAESGHKMVTYTAMFEEELKALSVADIINDLGVTLS